MENKEDNIEDLFRERFENEEVMVSPKVWENIKNTLPDNKDSIGFNFSLNTILWSSVGILVLSAVIGTCLYVAHNKSSLYSSQQATSTSLPLSGGEKSTSIGFTDDSSSLAHNHQASIQKAVHHNTPALHSKSSSSDYSKESNRATHFSDSSLNSNKILFIKGNKTTSEKNTPDFGDHQIESKKQQKRKLLAKDQTHVNAIKKAQKFSSGLQPNQRLSTDHDKEKSKKDQNQTLEYRSSLADKEKKSTPTNTVTNNTLIAATDSVLTKSDAIEIKGKNNLSAPMDTSQFISNKGVIGSLHATDSVTVHVSPAQESLNNKEQESIVNNNRVRELLPIAQDSLSYAKRNDTQATTKALHAYALKDSALLNQTISSEQAVNKDSLSKRIIPSMLAQDSSLVKLDSLQSVHSDSVLAKTIDKKERSQSKLWSRLSFDLFATTLLTGASTSTRSTDSIMPAAIEDKNRNDKNSLGYSAGIMVNYQLSDRLHASLGIAYTVFTEQYHFTYTLKQSNWVSIDSTWQLVEYDSIHRDFNVKDQYSFLSIPLQLSYTFLQKRKLKLSAAVGLRSNILIKGATYIANAQKTDVIKVTSGFNNISFMYQLSLEAAYQWNEHMALLVQPVFLYGATSIYNKASSLQQKPYGLGVTLGLRVTF